MEPLEGTTVSQQSYLRGRSVDMAGYASTPIAVDPAIDDLKREVFEHPAVEILRDFGARLGSRPLRGGEMRTLLASEGVFVLEFPPGIVNLASRITDEWLEVDPFKATGRAARILFAAVDEYGLNDIEHRLLPSHHELYLDMAAHFGMTARDLVDSRYIVPAAAEFAAVIREYYRRRPIVEALGFHLANEATAPLDFGVFLETFRRFRTEYGFEAENDPILNFLLVHEDVEVSHREMGIEMLQLYTGGRQDLIEQARAGVRAYMECYGRFFARLDEAIFGHLDAEAVKACA